jgi:hypothetical protein
MPLVVFEPTIPTFERAKAVHALDRAATVTDAEDSTLHNHRCDHLKSYIYDDPFISFVAVDT